LNNDKGKAMTHTPQGQLYIIAAPSGAGKTSLVSALVESTPDIQVSVSYTTRPKRPNELDGTNYFFVDQAEFLRMQSEGDFLESAKVFDHYYGTSKKWVSESLSQGIDVILEIDWQGAQLTRELMGNTLGRFIWPPSLKALKSRLTERAADDEAVIASRMHQASEEVSHYDEFDYLVVNDNFEQALDDLRTIIMAQRLTKGVQQVKYRDLLNGLLHG